ncbi:MAG: Gfo/Idh/MocA family oxidoreductase, partial [Dehalococcoidia bacterium]
MNINENTISVGVIGVGAMGQHHARILASLPGVRLIGVADPDLDRAQSVASQYGVPASRDYREMLDQAQAFTIAAPTSLHHAIGMECIRHNAHILVEKPLAGTVPQATELTAAAAAAGTVLQVGHVERFNPTFSELAKVLANQRILALEARRLSPFVERAADVSAVFDLMVHDLDLLLDLVKSPVTSIQAVG